jgi:SAM-dependent methyltransferase
MINYLVKKFAHNTDKNSISHAQRTKRFSLFLDKLNQLPKPISILDIGGTIGFWEAMNFQEEEVHITLLNLELQTVHKRNFSAIAGDATHLVGIPDQAYDIVFSNSVIEHLYTWENQQKMAKEVLRVGKYHFIQTPNYWFPIEPHWVFPFFQFLPDFFKIWLTRNFSLGHIPKIPDSTAAINQVKEIQLLSYSNYKTLFPNATIYSEKLED